MHALQILLKRAVNSLFLQQQNINWCFIKHISLDKFAYKFQYGLNQFEWQTHLTRFYKWLVQDIYNVTKFNWLTPEVIFLEIFDSLDTKYIYVLYTCNVYIIIALCKDPFTHHLDG